MIQLLLMVQVKKKIFKKELIKLEKNMMPLLLNMIKKSCKKDKLNYLEVLVL